MRTEVELNRIAGEIIGGGVAVHRAIGPGCFESAYTPCLAHELHKRGLGFAAKVPVTIQYESLIVPRAYEVDFIVEGSIVLELKATSALGRVDARQLLTYLRFTGCPLGLLMNFGADTMLEGIKRIVNNFPDGTPTVPRGETTTQDENTKSPPASEATRL
jgi:GxxExxY protein